MPRSTPINRRTLLRTSLGLGLGLAAAPLLTACGDGGAAEKSAAKSRKVLPSTVTANTVKADLPGTAAGVPNAFYSYPKTPARSVQGAPLKGAKTVKAFTETYAPPAPARGRNTAWQAIEKRLGGTVDITAVAADDYPAKFSTMVAGGELADVFMYPESGGVDHKAAFLAAECADLTPFLSGDKVKAYPNLAAIPASAWQQALYGDKLYGVPVTRYGTSGVSFYRHDLFKTVGVDSLDQITDLDRFFEVCKELTQPKKKQYAIIAGATSMLAMSAGAPYFWSMDKKTGKFTADLETDEYRSAVEMAAKLYKAGCYYPGTLAMTGAQKAQYTDLFKNGKGAYVYDGMPAYLQPSSGYVDAMAAIDKSYDVRPFVPVGSKAVTWTDNATLSESFVKKAPKARVEQILRLLDFIAAPFGTEEYTLINFGVEGTDFKRDAKGIPVLTPMRQPGHRRPLGQARLRCPGPLLADVEGRGDARARGVHPARSEAREVRLPGLHVADLGLEGLRQPRHPQGGRAQGHHLRPQVHEGLRRPGQGLPRQGRGAVPLRIRGRRPEGNRQVTRTVRAAIATAAAAATLALAAPAQAHPFDPKPGADGVGDPLFPTLGNGGYDVRHYDLSFDFTPVTYDFTGTMKISAKATQDLSSFNLDVDSLAIDAVKVDGKDAAFAVSLGKSGQELTVTPSGGLHDNRPFEVAVTYHGNGKTKPVGVPGWRYMSDGGSPPRRSRPAPTPSPRSTTPRWTRRPGRSTSPHPTAGRPAPTAPRPAPARRARGRPPPTSASMCPWPPNSSASPWRSRPS